MPYYSYQGNDASGVLQQGTLEAASLTDALENLQTRGWSVHSIALADTVAVVTANQKQQFYDQVATALANRQQWISALRAAVDELPAGRVRYESERLIQRLSREISVEEFLQDPAAVPLFQWIVSHSSPVASAAPLADQLNEFFGTRLTQTSQHRVWIYPGVLVVLVVTLLVVFAQFLIPIFREMYGEFGLTLPSSTRFTFWIADQITNYFLRTLILAGVVLALIIPAVRWWRNRDLTNRLFGRWVAGSTANLRGMARLSRMLADLLTLGAPLSEALRIAGRASRHYSFEQGANELAGGVDSGKLPAEAVSGVLPPSVVHALRAGGDGSPNIPLLHTLAQIYAERAGSRRDWVNTVFPAVGVVVIGIGVGFVMIALFLPLVSLVTSLA